MCVCLCVISVSLSVCLSISLTLLPFRLSVDFLFVLCTLADGGLGVLGFRRLFTTASIMCFRTKKENMNCETVSDQDDINIEYIAPLLLLSLIHI